MTFRFSGNTDCKRLFKWAIYEYNVDTPREHIRLICNFCYAFIQHSSAGTSNEHLAVLESQHDL